MKNKSLYYIIIFFLAFFCVLLFPKPDLRIEKLRSSISSESETLIIGNSILEHQSPCEKNELPVKKLFSNINVIGEGGLLLEEIELTAARNKLKTIIVIVSTYNFFQPKYYPIQSELYYKGAESLNKLDGNLLFYKNNLWRLNEDIEVGVKYIKRSDASIEVKKNYQNKRCTDMIWTKNDLIESIHKHNHNYFESTEHQIKILKNIKDNYNLKIIIVPIMINPNTSNNYLNEEYKLSLNRIRNELNLNNIEHEVLDLGNDISNYDEPWCMCGHLSSKGRAILIESIRNSVL
jgi:hypothetical protein